MELKVLGIHSQDELKGILSNFDLVEKEYLLTPLHIGYINDTYLISEGENPKYILQRVNHTVFKDVDGLMGNIDNALKHLSADDYEKIELISTSFGKSYFEDARGYWRLMTYLENSTSYNTTTSTEIAFEAGRVIGKFHLLLTDADIESYVDTIPQFHNLDLRERQFHEALTKADKTRLGAASRAISFAEKMLVQLKAFDASALPVRICHNDTKFNNVLFSKKTGTALCLIDLDTIMKGYFLYDFGDAVRTIVNTAPEDEQVLHRITFERALFESFVKGLAANGPFLNQQELDSLHLGAILMPFLHGIRALTDYLNNDIYYKVAYENQNLDRCLSLFDFTKKAFDEITYMKKIISNILQPMAN
jgi:Ser/Thr protein kinase RdoA (MazF antagonist)